MSRNIDKIFYINLAYRTDRLSEIQTELSNMELEAERYEGVHYPHNGPVGCGYSHINVLKLAKERKYKSILIFEDDFTFLVSKQEFEKNLELFFDSGIEYNVLMLSYNLQQGTDVPEYPFLGKIVESLSTSGQIIHENYYDTLIELFEQAMPLLESTQEHWNYSIDTVTKHLQEKDKWYYLKTRIGKQRTSFSDNSQTTIEYNC